MRKDGIQTRKRKPKKNGGDIGGKKDDKDGRGYEFNFIYNILTNIWLDFMFRYEIYNVPLELQSSAAHGRS